MEFYISQYTLAEFSSAEISKITAPKDPEGKTRGSSTLQLLRVVRKKLRILGTIWKRQLRGLRLGALCTPENPPEEEGREDC